MDVIPVEWDEEEVADGIVINGVGVIGLKLPMPLNCGSVKIGGVEVTASARLNSFGGITSKTSANFSSSNGTLADTKSLSL